MVLKFLILALSVHLIASAPSPEPWFGDFVGSLPDTQSVGVKGEVYIVNDTCIQITGFTYNADAPAESNCEDLYFWADAESKLTSDGVKLPTFEYGKKSLAEYENARVVLMLPHNHRVSDFKTFGVYCQTFMKDYGSVSLPSDLQPAKPKFLDDIIPMGDDYNVKSGPILVLDRRTVKIYGFYFDGDKAPDGNFIVGKGTISPENGIKVAIRGRDDPNQPIMKIDDKYTGQDVIIELPETHDIYSIDWISLYCTRFRVDFGSVPVADVNDRIPPYVPEQEMFSPTQFNIIRDYWPPSARKASWPLSTLVGRPGRTNFTFQLGPPGGRRAYEAWTESRPNDYVWYVNGYMTPRLELQRGVQYTFNVQGGNDAKTVHFYNPLYISDEPFGGYSKLPSDDKAKVRVFSGLNPLGQALEGSAGNSSGTLCLWSQKTRDDNPDMYDDFSGYSEKLKLTCEKGQKGQTGVLQWTPDANTPDTVYYQSFTNYNMGFQIGIHDSLPSELEDSSDLQFDYAIWLETNAVVRVPKSHTSTATSLNSSLWTLGIYVVTSLLLLCTRLG